VVRGSSGRGARAHPAEPEPAGGESPVEPMILGLVIVSSGTVSPPSLREKGELVWRPLHGVGG
jgi:hypothetical protein